MGAEQAKYFLQKCGVFRLAHLAGSHGEFSVPDASEAADVPIDRHVVGRIREYEIRLRTLHERVVCAFIPCIAAMKPVSTEQPEVSMLCDGRLGGQFWDAVFWQQGSLFDLGCFIEDEIDLGHFKAGDFNLEVHVDESLQLDRQDLAVPTRFLRELVVGQDVCALLCVAEMLDPQRGNAAETQSPCGLHASMTGDDRAGCVDQDRIEKSEAFDRSSNLLDLTLRMRARVMLIRSKCLQISQFRSGERNHGLDLLTLERHGGRTFSPLGASRRAPRAARVKASVLMWGRLHSCLQNDWHIWGKIGAGGG